jgi:hypothetical protein
LGPLPKTGCRDAQCHKSNPLDYAAATHGAGALNASSPDIQHLVSFFGRTELATAEKGLALIWPFKPPS